MFKIFSPRPKSDNENSNVVIGTKKLPPDPRVTEGLGRNHSFETAVSELVDNSIDAGATQILIRFMTDTNGPASLAVVDNGRGMNKREIDTAMTLGGRRTYNETDIGHFGVGLQASSLGQAKSFIVASKQASSKAVARRIEAEKMEKAYECEILSKEFADALINRNWGHLESSTGTVIKWEDLKSFPKAFHGSDVDGFISQTIHALGRHLGLYFHRILQSGVIAITIDHEDLTMGGVGTPFPVMALDPFAYSKSGHEAYPKTMSAKTDSGEIHLRCHIWPGRSSTANYKLLGKPGSDFQGLFVYKNDRLIQAGGWNGAVQSDSELQLGRVVVDVSGFSGELLQINPEKTSVVASERFKELILSAAHDETTFESYLADCSEAYKNSQKRVRGRPRVLAPGQGLAPEIKNALECEYDFNESKAPIEIRWEAMLGDSFFEVDKDAHRIKLNRKYRPILTRSERGSLNDAPVLKALIYLLFESAMRGEYLGPRDKDNIAIWQSVLDAAVKAESDD